MIITISGVPGSGKSTVGKLIAKKLGYRFLSIGAMRRAMARERGMTLQEFNVLGEKQAFTDREVDAWQKQLGQEKDNMVIEGRTSFHFIPHSVKIFLTVNLDEAARRIFHDSAHVRRFEASKHYETSKELAHGLRHRIASDNRRYKKYYGLNIFVRKHYDLFLDTTKLTPAAVSRTVLTFVRSRKLQKGAGDRLRTTAKLSTGSSRRKNTTQKTKIKAKTKQKRVR